MIPFRRRSSFLLVAAYLSAASISAACIASGGAVTAANGQEIGRTIRIADRCAIYGPGLVELGNGTCARVITNGHVHVEAGTRAANAGSWAGGGTTSAGMRSDGAGMLPGVADAQHLRVGGEPYLR